MHHHRARCDTAQCAIQTIGDLAVQYGFYGDGWSDAEEPGGLADAQDEAGEALTIADPNETWMFHVMADDTGTSAVWVAQVCAHLVPYLGPYLGTYLGPYLSPYLSPYLGYYLSPYRHLCRVGRAGTHPWLIRLPVPSHLSHTSPTPLPPLARA